VFTTTATAAETPALLPEIEEEWRDRADEDEEEDAEDMKDERIDADLLLTRTS
jgi:hypothetical protein